GVPCLACCTSGDWRVWCVACLACLACGVSGVLGLTSVQSLSQADGELSGLPTPDSTPELPIRSVRAPRHHQYENHHDSHTAADPDPPGGGPSLGFMAVVGNTMTQPPAFSFPHHHGSGLSNGAAHGAGASSTSLHLPEERRVGDERASGGGCGAPPRPPHSQQPLPQAPVDVSALDELLKHIHEVSASGTGGIKVLTSTSSSALFPGPSHHHSNHHHHHTPHGQTRTHHYNHHHSNHHNNNNSSVQPQQRHAETEKAPYYSTSMLPRDGVPKRLDPPAQNSANASSANASSSEPSSSFTPLQQQVIPETPGGSGASVTRHLIKMGAGGGAVPRHHSFNHRGAPHAHFLARMNTNSSSNGPPGANASASGGRQRASVAAATCLTRQHSYSEGPHAQRAAVVRRTVSLKPQVPPKPLYLPNAAVAEAGKYKY
ncbi:siderophore biosynthesis regulatory protein URBS1-like, partial [Etheostoma cragini]|uniref:siderophore biosynthesis regulatory protein URBS1-like n=1 Tax=Etheostoma cragini TaxID=417921 RepID=UPI00155F3EFE